MDEDRKKGFILFIGDYEKQKSDIDAAKEIEIEVRDRATYGWKVVKCIISRDPKKLPDGDVLWFKNWREEYEPDPWAIKILKVIK
ncbi:MAG: hypothetical protein SV062_04940 [Thermodesulfobacteriota bacterium]|nr:hypothetical protein [Thermodesulfobacteriota bacterium]